MMRDTQIFLKTNLIPPPKKKNPGHLQYSCPADYLTIGLGGPIIPLQPDDSAALVCRVEAVLVSRGGGGTAQRRPVLGAVLQFAARRRFTILSGAGGGFVVGTGSSSGGQPIEGEMKVGEVLRAG
jgi:hypothetical protein